MSIRAICPNGHAVRVKDKYAGKVGLCPICRARIKVPEPAEDIFTDDSIMDVLRPQESGLSGLSLDIPELAGDDSDYSWSQRKRDKTERICAKCHEKISTDARVCPHCHAYVAQLQD